jgi:hypothetical protein
MAAANAMEVGLGVGIPRIIAGDFNTFDSRLARWRTYDDDTTALRKPANVTEAAWWRTMPLPGSGYADPFADTAWTFVVRPVFRAKLDWIAGMGWPCLRCGVGPFASSDHRPIWVDLGLVDPAGR